MYEHGQAWAVRCYEQRLNMLDIYDYLNACIAARIATDFHRGALDTLELLE